MKLNKVIHSQVIHIYIEIETFKQGAKVKHVTIYMHAMVAHLPEFMQLYDSIVLFTQVGLEKLNVYTQYYFRNANHCELESLKQLLLKNHLETVKDKGYDWKKTTLISIFPLSITAAISYT